ncbi:hypothetical protein HYC85_029340 [Camellia sinensis]|uniref:Uncharacterized protein n=1 Tax=Camellia sinensis TaxID=4442 RepID=A0A7J7FXZ1_CAMSI|nr:hypothetical protein HYC85_029340 [Camellia sinensis]
MRDEMNTRPQDESNVAKIRPIGLQTREIQGLKVRSLNIQNLHFHDLFGFAPFGPSSIHQHYSYSNS